MRSGGYLLPIFRKTLIYVKFWCETVSFYSKKGIYTMYTNHFLFLYFLLHTNLLPNKAALYGAIFLWFSAQQVANRLPAGSFEKLHTRLSCQIFLHISRCEVLLISRQLPEIPLYKRRYFCLKSL